MSAPGCVLEKAYRNHPKSHVAFSNKPVQTPQMIPPSRAPNQVTNQCEMEGLCREKVKEASQQLEIVMRATRQALTEFNDRSLPSVDGGLAVIAALRAENSALSEYVRVLRILTDLLTSGKTTR